MSKLLTVLLFLVTATPAFAEAPCPYVDKNGDRLIFVDDGENTVTLAMAGKPAKDCGWALLADGPNAGSKAIGCDGGPTGPFSFESLKPGTYQDDLVLFQKAVWRRACP